MYSLHFEVMAVLLVEAQAHWLPREGFHSREQDAASAAAERRGAFREEANLEEDKLLKPQDH